VTSPLKRGSRSASNYIFIDKFFKFNTKYLIILGCTSLLKRGIRSANNYIFLDECLKLILNIEC
jgi:hypothetical protein